MSTIVPPVLSTRIEQHDEKLFAVCSAAGGKPAATVSWEETWGYTEVPENRTTNADGSVTVERWLPLLSNDVTKNLTCLANHPSWTNSSSSTVKNPDSTVASLESKIKIKDNTDRAKIEHYFTTSFKRLL